SAQPRATSNQRRCYHHRGDNRGVSAAFEQGGFDGELPVAVGVAQGHDAGGGAAQTLQARQWLGLCLPGQGCVGEAAAGQTVFDQGTGGAVEPCGQCVGRLPGPVFGELHGIGLPCQQTRQVAPPGGCQRGGVLVRVDELQGHAQLVVVDTVGGQVLPGEPLPRHL